MEAASIVLSPALQVIFDRLASPALEAIADTLGFEDKLNSLRDSIKRVKAILQAAEDKQITNQYVRLWLSNLKKAVSDAEDLLDLSFACYTDRYHINSILNGPHAAKIKEAIQRLEKTINEGLSTFNFGEPSIGDRRSILRETGPCILDPKIYGRDDEKEKLVDLLLSSETSQDGSATCIPIIGIGGIGKTTLAQLAYNDERVSKHFGSRMWVFVSENFNVKKIMRDAIELVTKKKCKLSAIASLQSRLLELLQKNRCLIVLDNVWTEDWDDWKELNGLTPLFRAGLGGCKIILTTRSQQIPLIMRFPNSPFYLNGLKDDDCWSVFKQEAFQCGEEEKYSNLTRIGKEIIKKIGGVPLAAKCLGRSMLSEREENKWLFKRDCELWESDESKNKLFLPLMLSLSPHLRQCFAFCSLFPKNYEFKKQKLIHLWMAEGFIPEEGSKQPEDIGEEYFSELLGIYFLQEVRLHDGGEIIGYKMNDIFHDLARYVAGKEYVVFEQGWPQNWSPTEIRHAYIVYRYGARNTIPKTLYKAKHLRTLLLIGDSGSLQNGDKIYSSFEFLRVLDLNNYDLVDLPNSLDALKCLRYFDLSYTGITQLPESAQYLVYLQTLNLICCQNLESLPSLGKNLRHLNLSGCVRLTGMPPDMKHLRHL
ncbi:unnamed protein product [Prunus brigantina]